MRTSRERKRSPRFNQPPPRYNIVDDDSDTDDDMDSVDEVKVLPASPSDAYKRQIRLIHVLDIAGDTYLQHQYKQHPTHNYGTEYASRIKYLNMPVEYILRPYFTNYLLTRDDYDWYVYLGDKLNFVWKYKDGIFRKDIPINYPLYYYYRDKAFYKFVYGLPLRKDTTRVDRYNGNQLFTYEHPDGVFAENGDMREGVRRIPTDIPTGYEDRMKSFNEAYEKILESRRKFADHVLEMCTLEYLLSDETELSVDAIRRMQIPFFPYNLFHNNQFPPITAMAVERAVADLSSGVYRHGRLYLDTDAVNEAVW